MNNSPALQLFGAGREKRIYAIPPYTSVVLARFRRSSVRAVSPRRQLRAVRVDGKLPRRGGDRRCGGRMFVCSDTDYCEARRAAAKAGGQSSPAGPRAWGRHMLEPAKLRVRPATESDLEKILDLYAQTEFDAGDVLPLAAAKHVFERFADYPDYTLYVAEHGGEIVGHLCPAGDAQPRPPRCAVGHRRGCRRRRRRCSATASARR